MPPNHGFTRLDQRYPLPISASSPDVSPQNIIMTEHGRLLAPFQLESGNWVALHIIPPQPANECKAAWVKRATDSGYGVWNAVNWWDTEALRSGELQGVHDVGGERVCCTSSGHGVRWLHSLSTPAKLYVDGAGSRMVIQGSLGSFVCTSGGSDILLLILSQTWY